MSTHDQSIFRPAQTEWLAQLSSAGRLTADQHIRWLCDIFNGISCMVDHSFGNALFHSRRPSAELPRRACDANSSGSSALDSEKADFQPLSRPRAIYQHCWHECCCYKTPYLPGQAVMDETGNTVQIAGLTLDPSTREAFLEGRPGTDENRIPDLARLGAERRKSILPKGDHRGRSGRGLPCHRAVC